MRSEGRRIIDPDVTSMDSEPIQLLNALSSVFNRPHCDEAKTSRPAGLHNTNLDTF